MVIISSPINRDNGGLQEGNKCKISIRVADCCLIVVVYSADPNNNKQV